MSEPITIPAPSKRFQTSLTITAEQVNSLTALLGSGVPPVIVFPEGKTGSDLVLFSLSVSPTGTGRIVISMK